jgi:hypothetical protein
MEWGTIWRTLFCGWDGDVDLAALGQELATMAARLNVAEEREAVDWVCRQIQEAY